MTTRTDEKPPQAAPGGNDRPWEMRFLDGMCLSGWIRLLWRNRFAVSPSRIAMALIVTLIAMFNALLWVQQALIFGRRIRRTRIEQHPIFVIGHWRSGTTLLHELLVLDRRHATPNTYACFAPNHFLASGWLFKRCLWFLIPSRRPMDNVPLGFDRPQEDEFALLNMGVGSPYSTIAFANRPPQQQDFLDFKGVSSEALNDWKRAFVWFLKCITLRNPKRIVLKSPPHTCRIKVLLELFPDARFIHIVRDPYVVFPSTVNLWKRLYYRDGLQKPHCRGLEEHVFATLTRMYEAFESDRQRIGPGRYCEVRYEDLAKDPIQQMRMIYDRLELDQFDQVLPALEQYVAGQKDYKTNRYEITDETRAAITRRWGSFIDQYGYQIDRVGI